MTTVLERRTRTRGRTDAVAEFHAALAASVAVNARIVDLIHRNRGNANIAHAIDPFGNHEDDLATLENAATAMMAWGAELTRRMQLRGSTAAM